MESNNIKIYFIVPSSYDSELETSEIMKQTYKLCREQLMPATWERETNFVNLPINKTDIVVFESFEGDLYNNISKEKSTRIVGPWCVFKCITAVWQIPNSNVPILNVAMYNCIVCVSSSTPKDKSNIKKKVQHMGGIFTLELTDTTTHLVTNTLRSLKYLQAGANGLNLMLSSWVDEVWEDSKTENIHCSDPKYRKHKIPPLHNLRITCTGFYGKQLRTDIINMVNENGGIYNGQLALKDTDILICEEGPISQKLKAARKAEISCVTIDWLKNSISSGYALPETDYAVKTSTSTPNKDTVNPNFSLISNINSTMNERSVDVLFETLSQTNANTLYDTNVFVANKKRKSMEDQEYNNVVDNINMIDVKRAGAFLDGCSIYIVGFGNEQREKIIKILNGSGATRYDAASDQITHVIIGDSTSRELQMLLSKGIHCAMVGITWLTASISSKCPVAENVHLIEVNNRNETVSPLSKRSLRLDFPPPPVTNLCQLDEHPESEPDLLQQYLQPNATDQEDSLAILLDDERTERMDSTENVSLKSCTVTKEQSLFTGLSFRLYGFETPVVNIVKHKILQLDGNIVNSTNRTTVADYTVLPVFLTEDPCVVLMSNEVVTDLWLSECEDEKIVPSLSYHHRYVKVCGAPLENCVVTISGYGLYERNFLINVIEKLKGVFQEQLCRCDMPEKRATTHLISLLSSGAKYQAALRWNIPVLNKDWLLDCAKYGTLLNVDQYLVSDAQSFAVSHAKESLPDFNKPSCSKTPDNCKENIPVAVASTSKASMPAQCTPLRHQRLQTVLDEQNVQTPVRNRDSSPICSQVTPVSKIMEDLKLDRLNKTPDSASSVKSYKHVDTPETPLGRFITSNPGRSLKKNMQKFINGFPDHVPIPNRNSTPLSELKRRLWNKILPKTCQENGNQSMETDSQPEESDNLETDLEINSNLQEITDMVNVHKSLSNATGLSKRKSIAPSVVPTAEVKGSQANTITWEANMSGPENLEFSNDESKRNSSSVPYIMLSGFDSETREEYVESITQLTGVVSKLANFDINSTHLICPKPTRNEKLLASIASGKWILHFSYINDCLKANKWLNEEEYEFGNPKNKFTVSKECSNRAKAIHWWRREILRRGYGAFHDVRAIIVASNREPLINVIEAGGGIVVDIQPPYDDSQIHATHCFIEMKSVADLSDYVPLARQNIYCLNTLYISEFLDRTCSSDIRENVIPHFKHYFS